MAQVSMAYFNYIPPVTVFMASQQEIETKASAHQHDGGLSENQGHLYLYCDSVYCWTVYSWFNYLLNTVNTLK